MTAPTSRRRSRRLLAVFALPALVLLGALGAWARGTWAEAPRDPAAVGEGPTCCVCLAPDGGKEVRCALRVPFPMDEVWAAVTDYEHFGDICPYIRARDVSHDPDGRTLLQAEARSGLGGHVPFEVELRREQMLDEYVSTWDQASGDVEVNRGRWVLRPTGPRETLVAVSLEVQVRGVPTFILRNISRHRLRKVAQAVERRLVHGGAGEKW
jgi:hypothetical protein